MNTKTQFRRIAAVSLTVLAIVVVSAPALAAASSPPTPPTTYQRLKPRQPDPDVEAIVIAPLCADIVNNQKALSQSLGACPDWTPALAFCTTPLDMRVPRPTTAVLTAIDNNKCPASTTAAASVTPKSVSLPSTAGILSVGWQDAAINAIGAILVDRAKAEALASAAERFQDAVCGDKTGKSIFAQTCLLLGDSDPYSVPVAWGRVKATIERDLHNLPLRFLSLDLPLRTKAVKDAPLLLYTAVDVTQQAMLDHVAVVPLFVDMQTAYAYSVGKCSDNPTACGLMAAGIVAEVVIAGFNDDTVAPLRETFEKIAARVVVDRAIALGLIPSVSTTDAVLQSVQASVAPLEMQVKALDAAIAQAPSQSDLKIETLTKTLSTFTSALLTSTGTLVPASDGLSKVQAVLADWNGFVVDTSKEDYFSAGLHLLNMFDVVFDDVPACVNRYLPTLIDLADAKTSDAVTGVLENLAAPVGSYRSKRGTGNRKLTINGYLGAQGGWEWLGGTNVPRARSLQGGVFAPVGIESSWGFGKSSSVGLFFSVIDLGAVVSFRDSSSTTSEGSGASTSTVDNAPQVGFSQIFSPGLYAVYGIPTTPLVFGVGGALTPELRRVSFAGGTTTDASTLRVGAFLAIDVTLFPF